MQRYNILVGAIPIHNGKVLLTQRSIKEKFLPGAWGLPCGKIKFGESLEAAVLRELYEETGLSGVIERLVGYSSFMSKKENDDLHNLQINFTVRIEQAEPILLDQSSQAYEWIELEAKQLNKLDDFTRSTIMQALSGE